MKKKLHTTVIEVADREYLRPYDERAQVLRARRKRELGREQARVLYNEARAVVLLETTSKTVLRRGIRRPGGFVDTSHVNVAETWQDVAQTAAMKTLERDGCLNEGASLSRAVNAAAYNEVFNRGGIRGTRKHRGKPVEILLVDADVEVDGWMNEADARTDVDMWLATLTESRQRVVRKRVAGEPLSKAESMVLLRLARAIRSGRLAFSS